jgi:membrane protein YqaA with SNARE-associated domain
VLELTHYLGLFFSAFAAATLLPLQSEAVLVGLLLSDQQAVWILLAIASTGNVLGSMVNWMLGRYLLRFRDRRWFPVSDKQLQKAESSYRRYGHWSLLLSWLPIVGDPLTVMAGVLREPLWRFMLLVGVAKISRYMVLAALTLGWAGP